MISWKPIDSLPPDVDVLLCFMNNPRTEIPIITTGSFNSLCKEWDVEGWTAGKLAEDMKIPPTHWMPLPKPPTFLTLKQ